MNKIAIIGAPTSGKSNLAIRLAEELDGKTAIIDNYIDEIGREADLQPGIDASYIGNLFFITGRYGRERKAWSCGCYDTTISCGTLIESSVYATMNSMALAKESGQEATNWTRITNFMNLLGSFYQDTLGTEGYDYVFVSSLEEPDVNTIEGQVDRNLFMALSAFNVGYVPLTGTNDEKIKTMLETIKGSNEQPTEIERQGV